jgi:hypothetical protein
MLWGGDPAVSTDITYASNLVLYMATHGPLLAPSTGVADTELSLPYLPGYSRREMSVSLAAKRGKVFPHLVL